MRPSQLKVDRWPNLDAMILAPCGDCYRKVITFVREHPDNYGPGFEDVFVKLVNRLDPPGAA